VSDAPVIQPQAYTPPGAGGPGPRRLPARRLWVWAVIGSALLVFALAMLFLFTARAVTLEIDPAPDTVQVSGGFAVPWAGRYLMPAGDYRVKAEKARYHPLDALLTVTGDTSQTHRFEMQLLPGRLVVRSTPEQVTVRIGDEEVARLPAEFIELEAGDYRLTFSAPRHEDLAQDVTITGGGDEQQLEVTLTPAWAPVTLSSAPPGATIEVDGEASGTTPATVEMGAGSREVVVRLDGYKPWQRTLSVESDVPQTLPEITLEPADGTLQVRSAPEGAAVAVGGQFRGTTPLSLSLASGREHALRISRDGYRAAERSVSLKPEEVDALDVTLEPVLGVVRFTIEPADATVRIDGKATDVSAGTRRLPARPHQLEVSKSGHVTQTTTFRPRENAEQRVTVRLLTEAEARLAANPPTVRAANGHVLRRVEPGRFVMGTPRNDQGRQANEGQRPVRLTRLYYLSSTEVTNAQFRKFDPQHVSGIIGRNTLDNEQQPVVRISWLQAVRYCNWLSQQEGLTPAYSNSGELITPVGTGYRLPSEAEWAWAARFAGRQTPLRYPWGDAMPPAPGSGNFADASAQGVVNDVLAEYRDGFAASAPVGEFAANPLGLFDLGGNVAEWVHDRYDGRVVVGGAEQPDPFGPEEGGDRVIRGSSYQHGRITQLRLAYRDFGREARNDLGFRIARYAE
jgi:formylglycine-generating enzyme required for sulfatase activity